ncbi:MAG TPA: TonB family protein [Rhizomicrobium sp.]|jgi:TonB family protein|nr:TonB family protein [Rhizomicrobium sp.]
MKTLILPFFLLMPLSALADDAALVKPVPAPGEKRDCGAFYPNNRREGAPTASSSKVHYTITETGAVKDPVVVVSSGDVDLDKAAIACASAWLYTPATRGGVPVAVGWNTTIGWTFSLHRHNGQTGELMPLTRSGFRP